MKFSTTVALAVFALPYLVNALPSNSKREMTGTVEDAQTIPTNPALALGRKVTKSPKRRYEHEYEHEHQYYHEHNSNGMRRSLASSVGGTEATAHSPQSKYRQYQKPKTLPNSNSNPDDTSVRAHTTESDSKEAEDIMRRRRIEESYRDEARDPIYAAASYSDGPKDLRHARKRRERGDAGLLDNYVSGTEDGPGGLEYDLDKLRSTPDRYKKSRNEGGEPGSPKIVANLKKETVPTAEEKPSPSPEVDANAKKSEGPDTKPMSERDPPSVVANTRKGELGPKKARRWLSRNSDASSDEYKVLDVHRRFHNAPDVRKKFWNRDFEADIYSDEEGGDRFKSASDRVNPEHHRLRERGFRASVYGDGRRHRRASKRSGGAATNGGDSADAGEDADYEDEGEETKHGHDGANGKFSLDLFIIDFSEVTDSKPPGSEDTSGEESDRHGQNSNSVPDILLDMTQSDYTQPGIGGSSSKDAADGQDNTDVTKPSWRPDSDALNHGRLSWKRDALADIDILNFALTLEHMESAFYQQGLEKYSQADFHKAGYAPWVRGRYEQIMRHERTHVEFLQSALGGKAMAPCQYTFPHEDPKSWVEMSYVFENVATSAYNGAVTFLQDKSYMTVAASIMGVEGRQAAWINSAVRKENPWNTAFETPLDMNQVYTLASAYIVPGSCPTSNAPIPVTAFPTLHVPPCEAGKTVQLSFDAPAAGNGGKLYAAFILGTGTVFVELSSEKKVDVPQGLEGFVYVVITKDGANVTDEITVAGPAVVWFAFGSEVGADK
ncbi:hypothetical protein DXG01_006987 [Tephrocybe rancida]|nr:hypothetical protein DXG01_006987 [Tephrocybe rancida]